MGLTCFNKTPGSINMSRIYGDNFYKQIEEAALSGVAPKVKIYNRSKIVDSILYQDIRNHKSLSNLSKEDADVEAFAIYTKAFEPTFLEEYGDWVSNPKSFKGGQYSSTTEPKVSLLIKKTKEEEVTSTLENLEKFLIESIGKFSSRLSNLNKKVKKSESTLEKDKLKDIIEVLENNLENDKLQVGVVNYLKYLNDDVIPGYESKRDEAVANDSIDSYILNDLYEFVKTHRDSLINIDYILKNSKELNDFYKDHAKQYIDSLIGRIASLEGFVLEYQFGAAVDIALEQFRDAKINGKPVTRDDVMGWFKDTAKDITGLGRMLGPASTVRDPIVRMVLNMIKEVNYNVTKITDNVASEIAMAQQELDKAGISTEELIEQHNGENTRHLISNKKWGEFYIERDKMRQSIMNKLDLPNWDSVVNYVQEIEGLSKNETKSDEKYQFYLKEYNKFKDKYLKTSKGKDYPNPPENTRFKELMKNDAFKKYYQLIYDTHMKSRERLPEKYKWNEYRLLLPQIRKQLMESGKTGGIKGLYETSKRSLKELVEVIDEDTEFGKITKDGELVKSVPIHYNSNVTNPKELSTDISGMYIRYFEMANNFKAKSEALEDLELLYRAMGEREVKTPNSVQTVQNLIETHVFGQKMKKAKEITLLNGKKIDITKLAKKLLIDYPSVVNMAFSIPVALTGALKSTVDTQMENFAGKFTTPESALKASEEFLKQIPNITSDLGSKVKSNKIDLLLRHNQVDEVLYKSYNKLNIDTKVGRLLNHDIPYAPMLPLSYAFVGRLGLSVYYNYRLVDGKFVTKAELKSHYKALAGENSNSKFKKTSEYKEYTSKWSEAKGRSLYDAYTVKNNKFVVKDEYKKYISDNFEKEIAFKIQNLSDILEGRRGEFDKTNMDRYLLGKAVMLHRGWIPQLVSTRLKAKGWDFNLQEENEGMYRTIGRYFSNVIQRNDGKLRLQFANWNDLQDFEKRNIRRVISDTVFLLAIFIIAKAVNNIADDEDEDKWLLEYSAYQLNRLLLEQKAVTPLGLKEVFSVLNSPMAGANVWERLIDINTLLNGRDVIESGAYKGKTQLERALIRQSFLKNLYEIRFPETKNRYLKSQVL